ncbi:MULTISPECIES: hypothetical protein [Streptomyces]|uniref:Uncharacterized protein n=2 Tax=Streptomyces TaxID=1883 RepID=A0A2U9P661_STRAS|nr:hypothetical protein [Streptomyces actuosus]AWT44585.1 hypothetical protein DMT42_21340 [Streptomyces actuosus]MBM4820210.1 hypothetical protein [Streptomyces actuosus]
MTPFLIPLAIATLIIAAGTAVLTRRDRRRMTNGTDTLRIETTATQGIRETRRRAHAYHNAFLRERE